MILLVSSADDLHTREVMARLARSQHDVEVWDHSSFPERAGLFIELGGNGAGREAVWRVEGGEELVFADCRVAWWRRPQPIAVSADVVDPDSRSFALSESYSAISGLWSTLPAFWINDPARDEVAARKVYQLEVAAVLGMRIPRTCITNDVEKARAFIDGQGAAKTVYKAFSGTERLWRETRVVKEEELELLDNVKYAPVIFQEYVEGVDLRVTVVGDRIFPAEIILPEGGYGADFRMSMESARFGAVDLPARIQAQIHALMARLGLVYGAIDMRRTSDGDFVFLEINPAGQWLFVEQRTGQPITDALAAIMLEHDAAVQ